MTPTPPPILLAEDDENERFIFGVALKRADVDRPLVMVQDGRECVDYLGGAGAYADRLKHPYPALLLLDLKMPRMDGFEVLKWLAAQRPQHDLPVIVLSSSAHDRDVEQARRLGATDYVTKPHGIPDLVKIIRDLRARWLTRSFPSGAS